MRGQNGANGRQHNSPRVYVARVEFTAVRRRQRHTNSKRRKGGAGNENKVFTTVTIRKQSTYFYRASRDGH